MPTTLTIDIADFKVSNDPGVELVTYSLGSCIGLTIWDGQARVGGLLHYMLCDSTVSPDKARANPAMFADTGVPLLFRAAYELGAVKQRLVVKVAGGAKLFHTSEAMDIGQHNYATLREILQGNGVPIDGEHVGACTTRTMRLDVGTGCVTVENRKMGRVAI